MAHAIIAHSAAIARVAATDRLELARMVLVYGCALALIAAG